MVTKFILNIPVGVPLKKAEKEKLNADLISSFQAIGDSSAKIEDSYYESKHALPEVVTYVVLVLTALSNIVTISKAIRDFLKKQTKAKNIRIKTDQIDITIKGDMTDEEIVKILTAGRKLIEDKKI